MPEDKKNADKKRNAPKEQRKPRHTRHAGKSDRKEEKNEVDMKAVHTVTAPQKPVYEDPGPEFYKNLKRETEEIVKITEAESSKYRNKEIQSNWAKYEMPIASYEDLDEQDAGADYEELIQAPLSSGGHFQFKHEKTWETSSAPSLYDKYFEIKMDNLSTAISTIPFFERNGIDQALFSETDHLSMNNRASKYKLKYYNDKAFSTPETDAQETVLKGLKENLNLKEKERNDSTEYENPPDQNISELEKRSEYDVNLDLNISKTDSVHSVQSNIQIKQDTKPETNDLVDEFDSEFIFNDVTNIKNVKSEIIIEKIDSEKEIVPQKSDLEINTPKVIINAPKVIDNGPTEHPVASKVNPVIESPEDLEKWLDDFLDS